MPTRPIPDGYHALTPYLVLKNAAKALEFYRDAFGAEELYRMPMPGGRVAHAEMKVGDSHFMLADESPEMGYLGPQEPGKVPVSLLLYVEDVDARFRKAIAAGAVEHRPVENQFYGDRSGTVIDPFGHMWSIATHIEDIPPEEMQRRMAEMMKRQKPEA